MMSDFDVFEEGAGSNPPPPADNDDLLGVFDSNTSPAAAASPTVTDNGGIFGKTILGGANENGASDLFATTMTGEDGMEEYKLNDDDPNSGVEYEESEDNNDPTDLLDMNGFQRSRPQDGEHEDIDDDEDAIDVYGVDKNTPIMDANKNGELNNGRRGWFGRGGSNRNSGRQSSQSGDGESGDLLGGDDDNNRSPSWSNGGGGGGFFRRSKATPPPKSFDRSGSTGSNSNDPSPSQLNYSPRDGIEETAYGEGGLTGDDEGVVDDMIEKEIEDEQAMDNNLRVGDHIFIWQTYGINPRAYQRHAVVYSVTKRGNEDPLTVRAPSNPVSMNEDNEPLSFDADLLYTDEEDDVEVTVVSFYHFTRGHAQAHGAAQAQMAASGNRKGKRSGCKREHLYDFIGPDGINKKKPIHKVRYGRKVKKGLLSQKAGVGTALKKDAVGLILSRVQYVLDNPDHLPDHNALSANGECASLWCVTGRWCTLQGASILAITAAGQAGGALLAGGILSNLTLLVPMPGVWGMAGWWWYVPATVAYPFLVPMLVALGMCSLVPLEILRRNRKKWRAITDGLNHEFWSNADEDVKEEFFGLAATAEKEAEMRSFFGVREGEVTTEDSRYMPLGGAPGGIDDDSDDDEEAEVRAMQQMEKSCADMNIDLSGRPPSENTGSQKGVWGSFMGSFRRKESGVGSSSSRHDTSSMNETQRFHTAQDIYD